jgi:hypothetical protein
MMKGKEEKIDLLFDKNAAEQLSGVDWDVLNAAILSRLDKAEVRKSSTGKSQRVFKIAAGVAAAAAVVIIAVMIKTKAPTELQLEEGSRAVVKFIESKGTALVEIKRAGSRSQVWVDVGGSERKVARCDVEIIDLNGDLKKEREQAAWIIISRSEPVFADNGVSRDMMSMIYLF